jgi:hypothetical protein
LLLVRKQAKKKATTPGLKQYIRELDNSGAEEQPDGGDSTDWPEWEEEQEEEEEEEEEEGEGEEEEGETEEDSDAGKESTEALPNLKTRQLPIQTKQKAKGPGKRPTDKSTALKSSSRVSSPTPAPRTSSNKSKKRKQPTSSLVRVAWNDVMCEVLLTELVNLVRKGKVSDNGFKEVIWGEVAEKVRPYYTGNAPFNGKKNAKPIMKDSG